MQHNLKCVDQDQHLAQDRTQYEVESDTQDGTSAESELRHLDGFKDVPCDLVVLYQLGYSVSHGRVVVVQVQLELF